MNSTFYKYLEALSNQRPERYYFYELVVTIKKYNMGESCYLDYMEKIKSILINAGVKNVKETPYFTEHHREFILKLTMSKNLLPVIDKKLTELQDIKFHLYDENGTLLKEYGNESLYSAKIKKMNRI